MRSTVIALLTLSSCLSTFIVGECQQPKSQQSAPKQPQQTRSSDVERPGFISPSDVNVRIEPDVRTFITMAAINAAGFDYETAGQPLSPARAELRKDLARLEPALKQKLAQFYRAHRRSDVDEVSDAGRYAALSLLMTPPPSFSVYERGENIVPDDLKPLLPFTTGAGQNPPSLITEFYIKSGIKDIAQKYLSASQAYAAAYRQPVGELLFKMLEYFHANPEIVVNMKPLVISSDQAGTKLKQQKVVARTRTRQVFVIPDPLAALGSSFVRGDILNQKEEALSRRLGDDYIVIVGPSRTPLLDPVRQALIRFVIDPIIERHLKTALEYKEPLLNLCASTPTTAAQFRTSVYLIVRESLATAAEARMRRIHATQGGVAYGDDDATADLAQAYSRGAVLSFHFYESLTGWEKVGIGIEDFFDEMLATSKFDREAKRPAEFEPVLARVTARRASAPKAGEPKSSSAMSLSEKILASDDLIRQRRFNDARELLKDILAIEPNNARALYGMAQVTSSSASPVEADPKADENDKIQAQHERLELAIKLYRRAIENASNANEKWLLQWSHVLIGRILDFQDFRADAIAEYQKAIELGEIPNGAYKEAVDGKQRPFGQK